MRGDIRRQWIAGALVDVEPLLVEGVRQGRIGAGPAAQLGFAHRDHRRLPDDALLVRRRIGNAVALGVAGAARVGLALRSIGWRARRNALELATVHRQRLEAVGREVDRRVVERLRPVVHHHDRIAGIGVLPRRADRAAPRHGRWETAAVDERAAAVDGIGVAAQALGVVVEAPGVVVADDDLLAVRVAAVQHRQLGFALHRARTVRRRRIHAGIVDEDVVPGAAPARLASLIGERREPLQRRVGVDPRVLVLFVASHGDHRADRRLGPPLQRRASSR